MRSAWLKTAFVMLLAGAACAQSNPHTQIRWPPNCADNNYMVYNWLANTCINAGPAGASGQVQVNNTGQWGVVAGFTYDFATNTLHAPNLTVPGSANIAVSAAGIAWPPSCSSGTYVPATNSCVPTGTAANPGGTNGQVQYNAGGTFAGISGSAVQPDGSVILPIRRPVAPSANVYRPATSSSTGSSMPSQVIALLGNSLVASDYGGVTEFCNETTKTGSGSGTGALFLAGSECRFATNITVDASNNVTLAVNNADGYFQNGTRFTPYGTASVDGGCLYDSYIVTTATPTQITFPTPSTPCAPLASTPVAGSNVVLTTSIQKFGIGGASLDFWYNSASNFGFTAYKTWIQGAIAAGQMPVTIMVDAGIMTNSTRTSTMDYRLWMADLIPIMTAIEGISATDPSGNLIYVSSLPVYITTGNTNACQTGLTTSIASACSGGSNTGAGGVYVPPVQMTTGGAVQYVFPYGTPGSTYVTPATITSGAISAGANTVTVNPCPPDLWGGPGDVLPTTLDAGGLLRRHGNLVQMVVDSAASAAQELVSLTAIIPTGVTGLHNFQTCQVSFVASFAHAANAPIFSTEFTADQTWTNWKLQIPYDVAAAFPGNIKVIDTLTAMGRQVANAGTWLANELHPSNLGYAKQMQRELMAIAPFQVAPAPPPTLDPLIYMIDTKSVVARTPAVDINFDPDAASQARGIAFGQNCGMFYSKCNIDPAFFYPTFLATTTGPGGAGFNRPASPAPLNASLPGDGQTGDFIYSVLGGSWQPTTISGVAYFAGPNITYNFTGSPPTPINGRQAIMRPYYANSAEGAKFYSHLSTYPLSGTINLRVGTSTVSNLVFSVMAGQNPSVIGGQGMSCSQIEMQAGDWIIMASSVPGVQATAAGVSFALPAGGSWNPATCKWTDTSGTDYSIYNNLMATLVQQFRPPDATFSLATVTKQLNTQLVTSLIGVQVANTPAFPSGVTLAGSTSATTGGNCSNGTGYTFGAAYMPAYWGTDYIHAGAVRPAIITYTPVTGTTTDVIGASVVGPGVAPAGYTTVVYLLISGTYYAIGNRVSGLVTTTCPATGGGLIAANAADNGSVGFTGPTFNSTAVQTVVNCVTSGTATFSQPQAGASDKKVLVHLNACVGNASYTYPVPFTNIPGIFTSFGLTAQLPGLIPSNTTTGVLISGSTSTGTIVLEDY